MVVEKIKEHLQWVEDNLENKNILTINYDNCKLNEVNNLKE